MPNDKNLETQRTRRKSNKRIDYYPSALAQAAINAKRSQYAPCNNNSGILDTILAEWAELAGIKYGSLIPHMTSGDTPEFLDASTRARMTSEIIRPSSAPQCRAKTKSGGECRSRPCPGNVRCKWHGGMSSGPKSVEGKLKSLSNLRQYKVNLQSKTQAGSSLELLDS